jgi:molybdopterin synthase catalytic subunit
MQVQVHFFGILKDLAGRQTETLELPEGACVQQVLEHYAQRVPSLRGRLASIAVGVNQQYALATRPLQDGDEVALLPPVSGGNAECEDADGPLLTRIQEGPIDTAALVAALKRGEDGAVAVFEGTVRDNTRGRRTLFLVYEAYPEMALRQMKELLQEARQRFAIRDALAVHRVGRLEVGETSVLIAVASAHRAAAFDACRWAIDTLKKTVPIWKKEHFADGAVWADGEAFPEAIASRPANAQ